jgi:hypothetical protein
MSSLELFCDVVIVGREFIFWCGWKMLAVMLVFVVIVDFSSQLDKVHFLGFAGSNLRDKCYEL